MTISAAQCLVQTLITLGARHAFGVPGESYLAVLDAIHEVGDKFTFISTRHEGGAAFMAAAHGKLTGQPGICFVTRGPGATNAAIGVHTAMQDSVPMILCIGQIAQTDTDREAFQEVDYRQMFGPLAKWVTQIDTPDRVPEVLARAWAAAVNGRPGPVVIALPETMLSAPCAARLAPVSATYRPAPSHGAITGIMARLKGAKRPALLVGGGGWTPKDKAALQTWAEASDIPVVVSFRCQDMFDNTLPTYVGDAGLGVYPYVRNLLQETDCLLALGVRFGEITTSGWTLFDPPQPRQWMAHVHRCDKELGKIYQPDMAIHADPGRFISALEPVSGGWGDWRLRARAAYEKALIAPKQPGPVDMGDVIAHLQKKLPDDAILTNGAGNFATWSNKFFVFGHAHRLLAPQSGAMGFGLPAAIAAKYHAPSRTVVCICGDGDFQMSLMELGTAAQIGARPIVLIVNNGTYGTIRMHQERTYPSRVSGTDIKNPDFVALAHAYGFYGQKVEKTSDFAAAFDCALASKTGAVLDLDVSIEALSPWQTLTGMGGSHA